MIRWFWTMYIALIAGLAFVPDAASAHEVRPAYLSLEETAPGEWQVIWKQPVLEGKRLKIDPKFAGGGGAGSEPAPCEWAVQSRENLPDTTIERGPLVCAIALVTIEGLDRTLTDTIVDVRALDAEPVTVLLRPDDRVLDLREPPASAASAYFALGIEHIVLGWDHLLFVIALVVLIASPRRLLGVITAFTLAHSLTLGLAALGFVGIPSRPVEILIAASIVLLALEILRKTKGEESLVIQRPYLVAILVGLVHGLGFAGALSEIGLPQGSELIALAMFNIGVEIGQIAVILIVLAVLWLLGRWKVQWRLPASKMIAYAVGVIGMFWMMERVAGYFA